MKPKKFKPYLVALLFDDQITFTLTSSIDENNAVSGLQASHISNAASHNASEEFHKKYRRWPSGDAISPSKLSKYFDFQTIVPQSEDQCEFCITLKMSPDYTADDIKNIKALVSKYQILFYFFNLSQCKHYAPKELKEKEVEDFKAEFRKKYRLRD